MDNLLKFRFYAIKLFLFLLLLGIYTIPLSSTVIRVPLDQPTIQLGLNAALSGDTVLVAANTYSENLTWPSRDGIVLLSEAGATITIIDGGSSGRVIGFPNFAYSNSTEINGFTIRNGYATNGGGIYITRGSPYIRDNIIQRNIAEGTSTWVYGGGIFCDGVGSPLIVANIIRGNAAKGEYWNYGGGIYIDWQNSAYIIGNIIENDSTVGGSWNYGAGIYCDGASSPDIRHNVIQNNVARLGSRGHGAGIYIDRNSNAYILSNLIYNNTTQSGSWNYGGGILTNSGAEIINNTIANNRCVGGSWRYGGGICIYDSTNLIGNNIIVNNSASSGGGIYAGFSDHATLLNNDVWNNTGGNYSGIAPGADDISVDPLFCIGPLGDFYLSQIAAGQGSESPCIDYGYTTAANLQLATYTTRTDSVTDADTVDLGYHYPIEDWVVGIFEVTEISAIPRQNYVLLTWKTEAEVNSFLWLIQRKRRDESYITIGTVKAQGNTPSQTIYHFEDHSITLGERYFYQIVGLDIHNNRTYFGPLFVDLSTIGLIPRKMFLAQNVPNPFTDRTTIQYHVSKKTNVTLDLYDCSGRRIRNLINTLHEPGYYQTAWNGKDSDNRNIANGIYFCRMTSNDFSQTIRLTKF